MEASHREALGLLPWITFSWLLALAGGVSLWLLSKGGRPARSLWRLLTGEEGRVSNLLPPGDLLLALYALGLPYGALLSGFLDAGAMGLGVPSWPAVGRGSLWGCLLYTSPSPRDS